MALNWDDIRFFLSLCRKNSLVSAATELQVTHSTVSRRISALEGELQTLLFLRSEKGCTLTPAGEKLLHFAENIENQTIALEDVVGGYKNRLSDSIRIGTPDGLGTFNLAACLARLQADHPALEIELVAVPMYYSLVKREIDILITVSKPTFGNVVVRKLTDYRLGLFAAQTYLDSAPAVSQKGDLRHHRIIGYIDDLLFDRELQFLEEISPGLIPHYRSTTIVVQMMAIAAGAGIGVIPYFMAHSNSALKPVLPDCSIERAYWLQVNPDSRELARIRTTIDFLVSHVSDNKDIFLLPPG